MNKSELIEGLAGLWPRNGLAVALTGAGISTESGIPDYRSPGGQWTNHTPPMFRDFLSGPKGRRRYWRYYEEFFPVFARAKPNAGHIALARLHRAGLLAGVVTQNIDGLHTAAGIPPRSLVELHGNAFVTACLDCGGHLEDTASVLRRFMQTGEVPACPSCGGVLKPRTVSFGQNLDEDELERARDMCINAELLLVVGSSLKVMPAAGLPRLTLKRGGLVAVVNQSETYLDEQARVVIREPAGDTLTALADRLAPE